MDFASIIAAAADAAGTLENKRSPPADGISVYPGEEPSTKEKVDWVELNEPYVLKKYGI